MKATNPPRRWGSIAAWKLLRGMVILFLLSNAERAIAQRPMGTDVSSFQGSGLNWTTLKNTDGISFAWTKATEGTYYQDADFVTNEVKAKAAGVLIGAYHFARPSDDPNITGASSADTEAAYFWSFASGYVKGGGTYLVPMLDWEDPVRHQCIQPHDNRHVRMDE